METKKRRVRRTPESYRKEVEEITNGEYSVLEDFINTKTGVLHVHKSCGHSWRVQPNNFVNVGSRCPLCSRDLVASKRRFSKDYFQLELDKLTGGDYSVTGDYLNGHTPVEVRHNVCGRYWEVRRYSFIQGGARCPKCGRENRPVKSRKEFEDEVHCLVGDEYTFKGTYCGGDVAMEVVHNLCGHTYRASPNYFLKGRRCPKCYIGYSPSNDEFVERVKSIHDGEYIFLEPYTKNYVKMTVKHTVCGTLYTSSPRDFFNLSNGRNGSRCPNCFDQSKSNDDFINSVKHEKDYLFLERYKGAHHKIEVVHLPCSHKYSVRPSNFLKGSRCPNCVYSRGEKAVADVLDSLSIGYIREHSFEYLGRKRYDFFIPSLNIAIEYDGEQHFKAIDHWGGEEYLESVRQSDALKNDFCDFMGIDLLRIPYWEFDKVDEIVTNFIDTVKLMRSISDRKEA